MSAKLMATFISWIRAVDLFRSAAFLRRPSGAAGLTESSALDCFVFYLNFYARSRAL